MEPSSFHAEACLYVEWVQQYENLLAQQNSVTFTGKAIRVEVSLVPDFSSNIIDTTIGASDLLLTEGPFDGVTDFDGSSGYTFEQEASEFDTFDATLPDGLFFTQPGGWDLYIRASPLRTMAISGHGHYLARIDPVAAAGVVVTFGPLP